MSEGDGVALFAAVKTFHTEGKDMLSAISQLVLASIEDGASIEKIRNTFELEYRTNNVPLDAIKTILKRLKHENLVSYTSQAKINLTLEGLSRQSALKQSVTALDREVTDLVQNMGEYFKGKGYPIPKKFSSLVIDFIDNNMALTSNVLAHTNTSQIKVESRIAEYILHVESSDSQRFGLLQNLFFGRLYLSVMRTRSDYAKNVKLDPMDAYLDTSILMSCLGLHDTEANEQAAELLKIIEGHEKIRAVVAEDTVNEARRLLNNFSSQGERYIASVPVHSIYYQLKQRGYDQNRVNLLLETLDERIEKLGIDIIDTRVERDSHAYKSIASKMSTWATLLEHPKRASTLDHDATVICHIAHIRKNISSKIFEKNKAIFVSPDSSVLSYAKEVSKSTSRFSLAITPLELTSVLWIRDIGGDAIATSVIRRSIMAYVRERAISHSLWEKFVEELEAAVGDNSISRQDVGIILASSETFELLATNKNDAIKTVLDPQYINRIHNKQDVIVSELEQNKTKIDATLSRVDRIARQCSAVCSVLLWGVLLAAAGYILYYLLNIADLDMILNIIVVTVFILSVICILILGKAFNFLEIILTIRRRIYQKVYSFIYDKLVRYFGLEG